MPWLNLLAIPALVSLVWLLVAIRRSRDDFDPVVFHVIATTAEGGAPVSRDWLNLAYHHAIYICAIQNGSSLRGLRGLRGAL